MSLSEFDLIDRYFGSGNPRRRDVVLGVGDDAALLAPPPDRFICTVARTAGPDDLLPCPGPRELAHRTLVLALNALAARGVEARWAVQALTLPAADDDWLSRFAETLRTLARDQGVALVGGDTTRGPFALTLVVHGLAETAEGAPDPRPGDRIYVTGEPGTAALHDLARRGEMELTNARREALARRLFRPEPRTGAVPVLRSHAAPGTTLEQGLATALGEALGPGLGASLRAADLTAGWPGAGPAPARARQVMTIPGDPELCFTVPPTAGPAVEKGMRAAGIPVNPVGTVEREPGLWLVLPDGDRQRAAP